MLVSWSSILQNETKFLGIITDNIEGNFDNQQASKLDTTCVTG